MDVQGSLGWGVGWEDYLPPRPLSSGYFSRDIFWVQTLRFGDSVIFPFSSLSSPGHGTIIPIKHI